MNKTEELAYEVSKERGGAYYCHPRGKPGEPVKGSFGVKKHALKCAARLCGMSAKEYMKARKDKDEE